MLLLKLLGCDVVSPDLDIVAEEGLPVTVDPVKHLQSEGWFENEKRIKFNTVNLF